MRRVDEWVGMKVYWMVEARADWRVYLSVALPAVQTDSLTVDGSDYRMVAQTEWTQVVKKVCVAGRKMDVRLDENLVGVKV